MKNTSWIHVKKDQFFKFVKDGQTYHKVADGEYRDENGSLYVGNPINVFVVAKPKKHHRNMMSDFNEQVCMKAIVNLREQGYMVLLLTENELSGVDAKSVENRLAELAWKVIEDLKDTGL